MYEAVAANLLQLWALTQLLFQFVSENIHQAKFHRPSEQFVQMA
jgi:hypothetical protein